MKISIKTAEELDKMRASGLILQKAQKAMKDVIQEGVSLKELDKIAEDVIRENGGVPAFKGFHGFPATICAMLNSEVVHGIPDDRTLKNGDLLSVDCGVFLNDYCSDAAFSVIVGGDKCNPERAKFSSVVREALLAGCAVAKPGNYIGDIGNEIEKVVKKGGYSIVRDYGGHGLGKGVHEEPFIPNFGKKGTGLRLIEGMTLAIEPIVAFKSPKTKVLSDNWTVVTLDGKDAIQWEHCGAVTANGLEIFA
ncbi:MAG: type I methionyl aminopeptidase [Candidatus Peregrinibacteria bacterium]|nr:type I methionyl aminopeptidase [Candidatus Peregrinibacteria bacterium]